MKKWLTVAVGIGLLLVSVCALADADRFCDEMPQGVWELAKQDNSDENFTDCILFTDTPLGEYCLVLSPWNMNGYLRKDGAWAVWAQVSPMRQNAYSQPVFRRHAAGAAPDIQGACGLTYPDDIGFDIIQSNAGYPGSINQMMQFHWAGDDFRLVGWQAGDAGQFAVWEDGLWAYFDSETGERIGSARIDRIAEYGIMACFDELPHTLKAAREMEAITQAAAETLFPGWTMEGYEAYNMGHTAWVGYYRVAEGMLTIRRVELSSKAGGIAEQTDTMPVPLSDALIIRLQTEDTDTLLDTSGNGDTFCTDAAFDRAKIPVTDTVLQNDLQSHGMLLLTEDADGVRRLRFAEQDGAGYSVRSSRPLPENAWLDLYHCGDDAVSLEWNAQNSACSFSRSADGNWILRRVTKHGVNSSTYGTLYCGIQQYDGMRGIQSILVGSHPWRDLFSLDFTQLPARIQDAVAGMDRAGWAVVSNPDPADRLHLRVQPDTSSESLGKFYNRTPVEVLEQRGGWSRVRIGLDGYLEGWMMTKYLAFGGAMDAVGSASPDLTLREEYKNRPLYASAAMRETTGVFFGADTWIVGVVGDELYILLDLDGNTGYLPQSWLWEGNG